MLLATLMRGMRDLRTGAGKRRPRLPRTRSSALLTVALIAGGVLGPLTGMAVGSGGWTTTVITQTSPCVSTTQTQTVPVLSTVTLTTTGTTTTGTTTTGTTTTGTTTTGTTTTGTTTTGTTTTGTTTTGTTTTGTTTTGTTTTGTGTTTTPTTPTTTVITTQTTTTITLCNCPPGSATATGGAPTTQPAGTTTAASSTTPGATGGSGLGLSATPSASTPATSTPATTATTTTPTPGVGCTTTTTITIPPYVPPTNTAPAPVQLRVPKRNPFAAHAMWIWELPATDHGNIGRIIAQARAHGIHTLLIKSGDGRTAWSQFNRPLVARIHAAHMSVCAWQYVYGNFPAAEAAVGALARRDGADCLVIDAEAQYQGRYVAAQTYIRDLRRRVGPRYPVALAGLPYIQYHTNFPYSIFLGPNGAQYNTPQMYWIDIGTTVPYVFSTTYSYNEIYQRPIFPLGQLYADNWGSPNPGSIGQFNRIAKAYRALGVSWWDFQSAKPAWIAATNRMARLPRRFAPLTNAATLARGARGDMVIWAQQHLDGAGARLLVDGDYGPATQAAVRAFQASHHLHVSGQIDGRTWNLLLHYRSVPVRWSVRGHTTYATIVRFGRRLTSVVALSRASLAAAARSERRH